MRGELKLVSELERNGFNQYMRGEIEMMLKITTLLLCVYGVYGYFTLSGKCPENLQLQEDFRLAEFHGKWYQVYHYSSDGQNLSNCTTIDIITNPSGIYFNQSRVDRGLFHRYSIGIVEIPINIEEAAKLNVNFVFEGAPRRLKNRKYNFYVLATNNNFYATVYTCQYSPLIDKHYLYVWILSRNPTLNPVSKELAIRPLQSLGLDEHKLVKDDLAKCSPKYYEDISVEPTTFRYPVPI